MMSSHLEHLGKLIEEVEIGFRSKLERIDIPQSLDILESMYDPQQQEVWNNSSRNGGGQRVDSSTADDVNSRQWNSTTTRTTGMSRIGAAMMEDITSEGDFVILHGIFRGTHKGDFHGIPATHRNVEYPMMIKYQIMKEKIVNAWPMFDQLALFEQLGVVHKP